MTNDAAQAVAKAWAGEAGGKLCPQLTENELAGIVNDAVGDLVKELRAARLAIKKMKASCNKFDEAFEIGAKAIGRANMVLNQFRQPVAVVLPDNAGDQRSAMSEASSMDLKVGRLTAKRAEWLRGYYCAVAALLREQGHASVEVRSLYEQGGSPQAADPDDVALFDEHGLQPNVGSDNLLCLAQPEGT